MSETAAQKAEREAAEAAQADKGTVEDQAPISTESDENGAVVGYIGKDAADLADEGGLPAVSAPGLAGAASYREPVPPGGHPADPTSYTAVGSAAEDETALAKGDASRIGGEPDGTEGEAEEANP